MRDIVVGIDGSRAARKALDAALRLGQLTHRTVRVVHAWTAPVPSAAGLDAGYVYDTVAAAHNARREAVRLLDEEIASGLGRMAADVPVRVRAEEVSGPTGPALVVAGARAGCIVVGSRAHSHAAFLGSALPHVLHRAACPVLVISEDAPPARPYRRVVVGLDGSESSRSALRWAADIAARDDTVVVAVHARGHARVVARGADAGWDEELDICLSPDQRGRVSVRVIQHRSAAEALLAEAGAEDLLVVGSRGLGGLAGLVLGSVSAHCVAHAMVPVVVVHAHEERLDDLIAARPVGAGRASS